MKCHYKYIVLIFKIFFTNSIQTTSLNCLNFSITLLLRCFCIHISVRHRLLQHQPVAQHQAVAQVSVSKTVNKTKNNLKLQTSKAMQCLCTNNVGVMMHHCLMLNKRTNQRKKKEVKKEQKKRHKMTTKITTKMKKKEKKNKITEIK